MRLAVVLIILLFFLVPVALFGGVLAKILKKSKADTWTGEVVDKKHLTGRDVDDDDKINHFYSVVFKTDDGRQKKVGLSKKLYDQWQVGDRGEKKKGKLFPEKV